MLFGIQRDKHFGFSDDIVMFCFVLERIRNSVNWCHNYMTYWKICVFNRISVKICQRMKPIVHILKLYIYNIYYPLYSIFIAKWIDFHILNEQFIL